MHKYMNHLHHLESRFIGQLDEMLSDLGVSQELIDRELSLMEPMYYGRTNSRVVLGSMNDLIFLFRHMLAHGRDLSLLDWSLELAKTPCRPIDGKHPEDVARALLENPHGFRVIDGGQT